MAETVNYTYTYPKVYMKNKSTLTGENYSVNSNATSFGYQKTYVSSDIVERTTITFFPPAALSSEILSSTTKFIKLAFAAKIATNSSNNAAPRFRIYAATEAVDSSAESGFKQLKDMENSDNIMYDFYPSLNDIYTLPSYADTEDSSLIRNALKYGMFISAGPISSSTNYCALYSISGYISVTLEYYTINSPPVAELTKPSGDGTDHPNVGISDGYEIEWIFVHPAGAEQSGYQVLYKTIPIQNSDIMEITPVISGTAERYMIAPEQMPQMPGYYLGITLWVKTFIQNNTIGSTWADSAEQYGSRIMFLYFPRPYDLSPNNQEIVLSNEVVTLQWKVKYSQTEDSEEISADNYPSVFDIEFSGNGGETWETIANQATVTREGDTYTYNVPENTFPAGIVQWRIRAYVGGKTIDIYERGVVTSRVQASTSSVTSDGKPRPTIGWSSSSQIAYQVRFADYDSGAIYGSEKSHTIPYFYADGNYPVQVRTQASDGNWSAWTEQEYVSIANSPPAGKATLTVKKTRHTVVAEWTSTGSFDAYILYRNGIPVYIGNDASYTDIAAYALCSYYVRAVNNRDYVQSNTITMEAKPDVDCICDIQNMQWIPLKYSVQPRSRGYSESANVVYKYYAGRSAPVAYVDGTDERQLNVSYVFKERADAERLQAAKGHLVIYKDTKGGRIIGILGPLAWDVTKRFEVSMTIIQVDYKEALPYET